MIKNLLVGIVDRSDILFAYRMNRIKNIHRVARIVGIRPNSVSQWAYHCRVNGIKVWDMKKKKITSDVSIHNAVASSCRLAVGGRAIVGGSAGKPTKLS